MARQVDIWWESGGRLKASMRWANKRGRISFTLIPAPRASCDKCPFIRTKICERWKWRKGSIQRYLENPLCSKLWGMTGDNKFEGRNNIIGWQPLGPLGREKKKKDKF